MEPNKSSGPRALDQLIASFLRENGLGRSPRHHAVFDSWTQALEPDLRGRAVPVRFRGDVLTIEVDSSAHLQELRNFTGDTYRTRANERLGKQAIRKVVFKLKS